MSAQRFRLLSLCFVFIFRINAIAQQVSAFPSVEGYGKQTKSDRGETIFEVTNLKDRVSERLANSDHDDRLHTASTNEERAIRIWYGLQQSFGRVGKTQPWINVLGRVDAPEKLKSLTATLNNGPAQRLSIGSDLHRLARAGDFNAELAWDAFRVGANSVRFDALWRDGIT